MTASHRHGGKPRPLTTEGAETPVRAARKEACEMIRCARSGHKSPALKRRQRICGRSVDEWHEVSLFAIILQCPAKRVSAPSVVVGGSASRVSRPARSACRAAPEPSRQESSCKRGASHATCAVHGLSPFSSSLAVALSLVCCRWALNSATAHSIPVDSCRFPSTRPRRSVIRAGSPRHASHVLLSPRPP